MLRMLLGVFRDLYVVLLLIFILDQIPGSDLLHDVTRKGVITVTVGVVIIKLVQPFVEGTPTGAGVGGRVPRRQKKTEGGSSGFLEWATCEMQGWRPAMEDATCICASLPAPMSSQAMFAVFDGHGGAQVSLIASREFPRVLAACAGKLSEPGSSNLLEDEEGEDFHSPPASATAGRAAESGDAAAPAAAEAGAEAAADPAEAAPAGDAAPVEAADGEAAPVLSAADVLDGKALHLAMLTMDAFLRKGGNGLVCKAAVSGPLSLVAGKLENPEKRNAFNLVGSTAIVLLVDCGEGAESGRPVERPRRVAVANCGDSRAILCRAGKAVDLSEDHKPELPGEERRIRKAGGHVAQIGPCHRIDGWGLNLSRALGDFHYKARPDLPPEEQKVIAVPEIKTLDLTDEDEFLVLGCDGVFELHTSQQVIDIVRNGFSAGLSIEKIVEELVDQSCSPNLMKTRGKGGDNCSAIVVKLRR